MKNSTDKLPKRDKWLVTGGRGFLGKEVCHKLASKQIEVVSVDKKPLQPNVSWEQVVMDITSANVSEGCARLHKDNAHESHQVSCSTI